MKEWKKPEIMTLGVELTENNPTGSGADGWVWELKDPSGKVVESNPLFS